MNPVRTCMGCNQTDDHPRHVIALATGQVSYHMDCCVENNYHLRYGEAVRGCEHCTRTLADAPDGARGDALRAHIVAGVDVEGGTP
jgi:hypothetical protein